MKSSNPSIHASFLHVVFLSIRVALQQKLPNLINKCLLDIQTFLFGFLYLFILKKEGVFK